MIEVNGQWYALLVEAPPLADISPTGRARVYLVTHRPGPPPPHPSERPRGWHEPKLPDEVLDALVGALSDVNTPPEAAARKGST